MTAIVVKAQQIAVVDGNGNTDVYQTLQEAIEEAAPGSTIYLPGGGFQISDDVKITKKLSIIGIGHKAVSENADGNTVISGNLYFNEGSSNSAVMGCYISGNVYIGYNNSSVNNIFIQYCNLGGVSVCNNTCTGTYINQNYIRGNSFFAYASVTMTNNIFYSANRISGGKISNNIITYFYHYSSYSNYALSEVSNVTISSNIFLYSGRNYSHHYGSNCTSVDNMGIGNAFGDGFISINEAWTEVFKDYNNGAIDPASDFHFKGDYVQYSDCGIYGGTGFDPGALPPVPFIVAKRIPEQTDASGKLNIKIRVKAGNED